MIISTAGFIGALVLAGGVVLLIQKVNHGKLWGGEDPFGNTTGQGVQAQDNIIGLQIGGAMGETMTLCLVGLMIAIFLFCCHSLLPTIKQCRRYNREFKELLENNDKEDIDEEKTEEIELKDIETKEETEANEISEKRNKKELKRTNSFLKDRCETTHWHNNPFRHGTPSPAPGISPSSSHFLSSKEELIRNISDSE